MPRKFGGILGSLGVRLMVHVVPATVVVLTGYTVVTLRATRVEWLRHMSDEAHRTSELVLASTHRGMLLNRKQDVRATLVRIAQSPAVAHVRIYNKDGKVSFSGDPEEIGDAVDREAQACVACHNGTDSVASPTAEGRSRFIDTNEGESRVGFISPIRNTTGCAGGACHVGPVEQTVLGVLDLQMSMAPVERALLTRTWQTLWATVVLVLVLTLVMGWYFYRMLLRPLNEVRTATHRVASGDLTTRVPVRRTDEIGGLADNFNRMTEDLNRARAEITEWSKRLEEKVVSKTDELGRAQRQILHMEKMASLGKLAATVAHELNNPLSGILTYAKLVSRDLAQQPIEADHRSELERYLSLIQRESTRCGGIVSNLLLFAKRDRGEMASRHLRGILERSLMLVHHHLEMSSVALRTDLEDGDDRLICDAGQLEQALVALFVNAVEAMRTNGVGEPILAVSTHLSADTVAIRVQDTGPGIDESALPHIFEPFFSTKEKESGVGLGLAVVYGIAQRHGGTVDVASAPGQGATFTVRLPRRPPRSAATSAESLTGVDDGTRRSA